MGERPWIGRGVVVVLLPLSFCLTVCLATALTMRACGGDEPPVPPTQLEAATNTQTVLIRVEVKKGEKSVHGPRMAAKVGGETSFYMGEAGKGYRSTVVPLQIEGEFCEIEIVIEDTTGERPWIFKGTLFVRLGQPSAFMVKGPTGDRKITLNVEKAQ